nr:ABC transporter permease [Heyndrickxia oleronia]
MNIFFNLFLFYNKRLLKSFFYLGTMLFMVVMLFLRFFIDDNKAYDYMDYGSFVGEMMLIIQAVMLLFIVFFYRLFSDEYKFGANNLFVGSFRITLLKIAALLCNHLLFLVIFLGAQISFIFVYFHSVGIPFSSFYSQTASYIIVYWFLPFVFAYFLGILVALLFGKGKISFVLMIVVWIAIGPMNTELYSSYFRKLSFSDLGSLFYIGPLHSENSFNELVGYNTSESAYLKITFWCISAIGIVFILLLKSARTVRDKTFILIICLFLLIGNTIIFPNIFQDEKPIFSYENSAKEIKYYKVPKEDVAQNYLQYSIKQYDITLNVDKNVSAETKVTVNNIMNNTLSFVLYHFFKVKKVIDRDGNHLPFVQHGDFVTVRRSSKVPNDKITFYYDMKDSAQIPISENYLYLPNYFSWIPVKSDHAPFTYINVYGDAIKSLSMQSKKIIHYNLTFNGEIPIYTNLHSHRNGTYSGDVSGGITVIAGEITKKKFGRQEVIYPNSWSDISKDWQVYEKYLIEVNREIRDMFHLNDMKLPNKIVLVSPNWELNSYLSSDHLLIQHETLLNISSAVKEIPEVFIPALLWNYNQRTLSSYEQIFAFNDILSIYIRDKVKIKSPVSAPTSAEPPYSTQKIVEQFYKQFYDLSEKQQKEFLVLWYKEMSNVSDSWLKTVKLFQGFRERVK